MNHIAVPIALSRASFMSGGPRAGSQAHAAGCRCCYLGLVPLGWRQRGIAPCLLVASAPTRGKRAPDHGRERLRGTGHVERVRPASRARDGPHLLPVTIPNLSSSPQPLPTSQIGELRHASPNSQKACDCRGWGLWQGGSCIVSESVLASDFFVFPPSDLPLDRLQSGYLPRGESGPGSTFCLC